MDPSQLSRENIVATILSGIAIAILAIRQYLKEKKQPTSPTGDRVIPGITIADMEPIRQLFKEQARTADEVSRLAAAGEGILKLLRDQAQDDAIEEEVERRLRQRQEDRRRRTTRT